MMLQMSVIQSHQLALNSSLHVLIKKKRSAVKVLNEKISPIYKQSVQIRYTPVKFIRYAFRPGLSLANLDKSFNVKFIIFMNEK